MPPKAKYTKEQIADVAFELVRTEGEDVLTARNLAARLGTSTAPIFTAFEKIEDIQREVSVRAWALYSEYIKAGLKQSIPFKGTGLMYIKFAREETNLFKLLFMKGNSDESLSHYFPSGDTNEPLVRGTVENTYGLDEKKARKLYNHLSVYVHGIAVMFAQGINVFSDEDVSLMLTEMFQSLIKGGQL